MCDRNLLGREIEGLKESLVACWCLIFQWDFWGEHCSIVGEEDQQRKSGFKRCQKFEGDDVNTERDSPTNS